MFEVSSPQTTRQAPSLIPKCGACGLYKDCNSPKMPVSGEGRKGILVVAEAPGQNEDEQGIQLIGKAGQLLRRYMDKYGVDLDRDCWKTNALICRPPDNRKPTDKEIEYCRPNLFKTIRELNPRMVMPLGDSAISSLLSPFWKENTGAVAQWVGWKIPFQRHNFWITPNYHPSHVLRSEDERNGKAVQVWFDRYLEEALALEGRPWKEVPDYAKQVKVVLNPDEAADFIRKIIREGGASAFDYETNRLKPDVKGSEIVSCAICWKGTQTIAYPWVGSAIEATSEYLRSPVPKIGANDKFEERWTRAILGHEVNNWVWDVMLSAHHQDNRDDITSVKFQAFVQLGLEPWNLHIEPYLQAEDAQGFNQIRKIDLRALLIYCGIDALVEYKIAGIQRERMIGR